MNELKRDEDPEQQECNGSWYLYEGRCVMECPSGTYSAHDLHKSVCSICHYTCTSCSGPSNTECTSCHDDANLITDAGEKQCLEKSLEWKSQTTTWFYRMTILFGLNITIVTAAVIYLCLSGILKRRKIIKEESNYDYNKLLPSTSDGKKMGQQFIHRNGCLSDSD